MSTPSGYAWAANLLAQPMREVALRPMVRSLTGLFGAVGILFVGSGLLGVLTPIRAQIEGFPTVAIGALGTGYYIGFVAGCLYGPRIIRRVGRAPSRRWRRSPRARHSASPCSSTWWPGSRSVACSASASPASTWSSRAG